MILLAHLWQSTLCAVLAGLLAIGLGKAPARTRHGVWLFASVKFLVPFSLLVAAGSVVAVWMPSPGAPRVSVAIRWLDQSAYFWNLGVPPGATGVDNGLPGLLLAGLAIAWAFGVAGLAGWRWRKWRALSMLAHAATPLESGREVEALERVIRSSARTPRIELLACDSNIEPGVLGVRDPKVLWPAGLSDRLTDAEIEAVLAHETCHVVRRDNALALMQMAVEVLFWFHPVVWWLSARIVSERERACDEEVLRMGTDQRSYAEGILKVCGFCLRSPIACVAGVGGSNLTQRVERIMRHRTPPRLAASTQVLLAGVAAIVVAAPLATGALSAHRQASGTSTTAGCDVTTAVGERPSGDPRASAFSGTPGPWYANADRTMWASGGTPAPGTLRTSVLWVRPAYTQLTIEARRVGGDTGPVAIDIPAVNPSTYQPSDLEFPAPGCWEITGTAGDNVLLFTISVPDPSAASGFLPMPATPQSAPRTAGRETFAVQAGGDVTQPKVISDVKARYTAKAARARIQGTLVLTIVVLPNGTVGEVTIARSLDPLYGLDDEAVKAVKQWRFEPGTRNKKPVAVQVEVTMTFALK